MNILLINTYQQRGGAAVACQRLFKAHQQQGLSVKLLVQEGQQIAHNTTFIANSYWQRKKAFTRFTLERLSFLPYERDKRIRFAFSPAQVGVDISQHPLVKEADVLHLHWINFGFLSLKSLRKLVQLDKPIVWTLHDMWTFTGGCHYAGTCNNYVDKCGKCHFLKRPHEKDLSYRIHKKKQALFAKANLHVVTCSQWLQSLAKESSLLRNKAVISIPNPIDTQVFQPLAAKAARIDLKLPESSFLVLFGAMNVADERKGFRYLEQALQWLRKETTSLPIELIIFGNVDKLTSWNFPFPVHFLGSIQDQSILRKVYAAADVFVLPSLEDNLPNTVMESMACGTPVVAFETGGLPEMIDPLKNGYLAKYKDAKDLAKGILAIQDKTVDWSSNARQKVLDNYTEETVSKQYVQLYKSLIK